MNSPIVDFLIIGAQKCGTSSLFELLKQHPNIAASRMKEPGYFLSKSYLKHPIDSPEKYHALFDKKQGQLAFEATVDYTTNPHYDGEIWNKIKSYNPEMKLIYLIRNPLDRILSAHRYLYQLGLIDKDYRNINNYLQTSDYHLQLSRYYFQIKPYIDTFGRDQVLILRMDELQNSPLLFTNKVLQFLGLQDLEASRIKASRLNSKEQINLLKGQTANLLYKLVFLKKIIPKDAYLRLQSMFKPILERKIPSQDLIIDDQNRARLREILLPEIEGIEQLTGHDLIDWKLSLS